MRLVDRCVHVHIEPLGDSRDGFSDIVHETINDVGELLHVTLEQVSVFLELVF